MARRPPGTWRTGVSSGRWPHRPSTMRTGRRGRSTGAARPRARLGRPLVRTPMQKVGVCVRVAAVPVQVGRSTPSCQPPATAAATARARCARPRPRPRRPAPAAPPRVSAAYARRREHRVQPAGMVECWWRRARRWRALPAQQEQAPSQLAGCVRAHSQTWSCATGQESESLSEMSERASSAVTQEVKVEAWKAGRRAN